MKRVTGIRGVFFTCPDPAKTREWYSRHLGIESSGEAATFTWRDNDDPAKTGRIVWSPFPETTSYFEPGRKTFMINYRVENLERLIEQLREEGVTIVGEIERYEYGKFEWILDPDGNKIELLEPVDEFLLKR